MGRGKQVGVCRGRLKHLMRPGVAVGWFCCVRCGQVAACPECVAVPDSMPLHLCDEHHEYEAVYSATLRLVWAEATGAN